MSIQYSSKEIAMTLIRHILPPNYIPFSDNRDLEARLAVLHHSQRGGELIRQDEKGTLKVSSWNVKHKTHVADIINAIQKNEGLANSDVIALQEIRRGTTDAPEEIARATGFGYVYGIEFLTLGDYGDEIGNMILSRHEFVDYAVLRLSAGNYTNFNNGNMLGSNMAVRARIVKDGRQLIIYSAHLELMTTFQHRRAQMEKLLRDAARYQGSPVLIAGDFNFIFENQRYLALTLVKQNGFEDPFGDKGEPTLNNTFNWIFRRVLGGRAVLDRVISKGLKLKEIIILPGILVSDHYPITAVYGF